MGSIKNQIDQSVISQNEQSEVAFMMWGGFCKGLAGLLELQQQGVRIGV